MPSCQLTERDFFERGLNTTKQNIPLAGKKNFKNAYQALLYQEKSDVLLNKYIYFQFSSNSDEKSLQIFLNKYVFLRKL
jgi:hypothetical protein